MHLLLFLAIGNVYGVSQATEVVYFIYAPLAVIVSVALGVSDVVVMPAMHRAILLKDDAYLRYEFIKRTFLYIVPCSIFIILVCGYFVAEVSLVTLLLMLPIPLLGSLSALYVGVLNSYGAMRLAVLGPFYGSILALPIVFLEGGSQESLAFILLVYELMRLIGLKFSLGKKSIERGNSTSSAASKKLLTESLAAAKWPVLGSLFMCSSPLIDILYASQLDTGSITLVEYASRLWNIVPLLFAGALVSIYSKMSLSSVSGDTNQSKTHSEAIKLGVIALILSMILVSVMNAAINVLFGLGVMSDHDQAVLAKLSICYIIGTAPFVSGMVYVRALSAERKAHIIASVALLNFFSNIILNSILIKYWGIYGIGLATSMVYIIGLLALIVLYRK